MNIYLLPAGRWHCLPARILLLLAFVPLWLRAAEQTLNWTSPIDNAVLLLNQPYPLTATASSGLPVTFRVQSGPAVITGGAVTATNVGTIVLAAEQLGDANHSRVSMTRRLNQVSVHLIRIGRVETDGQAVSLQVTGQVAYLADRGGGLKIIDVSDSVHPRLVGSFPSGSSADDVWVVGGLTYIADHFSGLQIIDVSDPVTPVRVGGLSTSGATLGAQVVGNIAYLADNNAGLQVIDVSNPTLPVRLGGYNTGGFANAVQVVGNLVYVAATSAGLEILNVISPAAPVRVGGLDTSGFADDVQVVGSLAYVADSFGGLEIIDVSEPTSPVRVGRFSGISGSVYGLQVVGNLAFLAYHEGGLQVLDVSDPSAPVRVGEHALGLVADDVQIVGELAYVASSDGGLDVFRVRAGTDQTLAFDPAADLVATNSPFTLSATAGSGLPVTFSVISGPAILEGNVLTLTGPGSVVVRAEQAGDAQFLPATPIERTLTVTKAPQTLTWVSPTHNAVLRMNQPYPLTGTSSSGLPVAFRVQSGPAVIAGGAVMATNVGTVVLVAEQSGNGAYASVSATRTINRSSIAASWLGAWPGFLRGTAHDVAVSGARAYVTFQANAVAGGGAMAIFDISTPSSPIRLGEIGTAGDAKGVQVVGNLAYVADGSAGVSVIDVSNPANPVRVGGYDTSGFASGVFVVGELAYVADGAAGLQILDVINPAAPIRLGGFDTSGSATGVQVVGSLAYVADYQFGGLQMLDVSNPTNPARLGGFDTSGLAFEVQVVGNLAYVADGSAGLQILDVGDPANPVRLGGFDTSGDARGVQVVGSLAYVADHTAGLQVLDVSNPTNPVRTGGFDTGIAQSVQVIGNLAYVADSTAGLQVLDVGTPTNIAHIGKYTTGGESYGVQVVGSRAYVADFDAGLQMLDVSIPATPIRIGWVETLDWTYGAQVVGTIGYVADGAAGLQVVDLSEPINPIRLGSFDTGGNARCVQVVGNRAYMGDLVSFWVLDVSNPASPVKLGSFEAGTSSLQMVGDLAYVGGGNQLQVINVSAPANLQRVGRFTVGGTIGGFQLVGDLAYVAGVSGLDILNIADPSRPVRVRNFRTRGIARWVEVVGNWAYVAVDSAGLQVLDISDPANPIDLGGYDTKGFAKGVKVVGKLAYVADDTSGLQVLTLREGIAQTLGFNPSANILITDPPLTLSAATSSGLSATFSVVSGPATVSGDQLTLTGVGTVVVRAEQAGNTQFLPASAERTLLVTAPEPEFTQSLSDPAGNLAGDTSRAFMDITSVSWSVEGANYVIQVEVAGSFPSAAFMGADKRFDLIWFVDADQNVATGQSADGNDYNIHLFLDGTGWHPSWYKVSPVATGDGITIDPDAFEIRISGNVAALVFPRSYLPTEVFDFWASCFSGNAPNWPPVTSNPLTVKASFLTRDLPPLIVTGPEDQAVAEGSPIRFTVTTTGTPPLSYQWHHNGVPLLGATNATLTLPVVKLADGGNYHVVVANGVGSVQSAPALLTLEGLPGLALADRFADRPVFTDASLIGMTNNLAATGETAAGEPKHSGKAGGKSLWLTWRAPASGVATFRTTGSSFDTLLAVYTGTELANLKEVASDEDRGGFLTSEVKFNAVAGADYQVAVDGFAGASGMVVLGWNLDFAAPVLPTITGQPADALAREGQAVTFQVAAGPAGVSYQWSVNGQPLAGANGVTLVLPAVGAAQAGSYRVRVTASSGAFVDSRDALLEVTASAVANPGALSTEKLADLFADDPAGSPVGAAGPRGPAPAGLPHRAGFTSVSVGQPGTRFLNLTGSTTEPADPQPCDVIVEASRWLRFRTPEPVKRFTLATTDAAFDTVLAVFTNRFVPVTVACNDDVLPGLRNSRVVFEAVPGVDYLVMVAGKGGNLGNCGLTWSATTGELEADPLSLEQTGLEEGHFTFRRVVLPGEYRLDRGASLEGLAPFQQFRVRSGLLIFRDPDPAAAAARFYRLAPVLP